MFNQFQTVANTNPNRKRKVVFWIVASVIFVFVVTFFIWVNQPSAQAPTDITQEPEENSTFIPEVTIASFENAKALEKVDTVQVGLPKTLFFVPGGKIGFFNKDFKLHIGNQTIANSPKLLPVQVYNSSEGVIINSSTYSTVYLKNGQFQKYGDNILQVTPYLALDDLGLDLITNFLYLKKDNSTYSIYRSTSLDSKQEMKMITTFTPIEKMKFIEVRVLNDNIYVFMYENAARESDLDIWKVADNKLEKVQSIPGIKSINFSDNKVIYTVESNKLPEITNYETLVLDFSEEVNGQIQSLDIAVKLFQKNILGNLTANRCAFDFTNNVYCLIKEKRVDSQDFQLKDSLVKISLETEELSFPFSGLVFSASNITIANNGLIYLVGQEDSIVYRIKD